MTQPNSQHLGLTARRVPREGESLSSHRLAQPDYRIDPETGCWEWLKFKLRGYGRSTATGHSQYAHRAYYEAAYGPIPPGHEIHHVCKNPGCVNPEHLEQITERDHDVETFLADRANGLTIDDVLEIRRLGRIMGVRAEDLAERYGVSRQTINNYWSGSRRWVDLLGDDVGPAVPSEPCIECGGPVDRTENRKARVRKYCTRRCRQAFNNRKQRAA